MVHQLVIFFSLIAATQCMFLHPVPLPIVLAPYPEPSYSFSYNVNDARTGDIKSQYESRRGDIVIGQYSLVQPDGIKRTVDYTANDNTGFLASVNNQGAPINQEFNRRYNAPEQTTRVPNRGQEVQYNTASTASYSTQGLPDKIQNITPSPVANPGSNDLFPSTGSNERFIYPSFSNGQNPWV